MPIESSVTQISDLNEAWPLGTDTRSTLDDHCRLIKVAVKSLLTNPGQIGVPTFVDAEAPSGVSAGATVLTLAYSPSPAASLVLVRNGVVLRQGSGLDYTLSGATITLAQAVASDGNEWFRAWYRR